MIGLIVVAWLAAVWAVLHLRYGVRRNPPRPTVVLRPIVIPARFNNRVMTDAEVVEMFLRVDMRIWESTPKAQRRDW